ncbi:MAG: hypothetical protein CMC74_05750 [Flavobacteriaceae bacterium]|nr:hypothetical protein [Flavobacteriaceae bacterium]
MKKLWRMWYGNILFFLLVLVGCKSQNTSNEGADQGASKVSFELLVEDSQSNIDMKNYEVIRSSERLQEVFNRINSTRKPGIPIPEVDFSKQLVLFLNMGQQNSGGFSVSVSKIEKTNDAFVVFVKEKKPEPTAMVTMVLTTPFTLVRTENTSLPVEFKLLN